MLLQADVLPDPQAYRAAALRATFQSVETAGGTFHGIAQPPSEAFTDWLEGLGLTVTTTCLRRSPLRQIEPHWVHTDADMGDWMAILYLNPLPPSDDGTVFWERADGKAGPAGEYSNEPERDGYRPWLMVRARWNSAVVFPAAYRHARALYANYGTGDDARLIQIAWGTGRVEDIWES